MSRDSLRFFASIGIAIALAIVIPKNDIYTFLDSLTGLEPQAPDLGELSELLEV